MPGAGKSRFRLAGSGRENVGTKNVGFKYKKVGIPSVRYKGRKIGPKNLEVQTPKHFNVFPKSLKFDIEDQSLVYIVISSHSALIITMPYEYFFTTTSNNKTSNDNNTLKMIGL